MLSLRASLDSLLDLPQLLTLNLFFGGELAGFAKAGGQAAASFAETVRLPLADRTFKLKRPWRQMKESADTTIGRIRGAE